MTQPMVSVLPLWQPWASLVAIGMKRIETRSWPAPQRLIGTRIAIHATKGGLAKRDELDLLQAEPFVYDLWAEPKGARRHDVTPKAIAAALPRGALIATCVIDRCKQITLESAERLAEMDPREHAYGNYEPGRYAWVLRDVARLAEPVPWKGSQGIFVVPAEVVGLAPTQETLPIGEAA